MSRHLALYNNKVPEAKAILIDAHNLPSEYYRVIAKKQKVYAQVLADVMSGYFNGKKPMVTLKAISYILFGMCNSIMHWHNPDGPIKLEELSDICFTIFLNGVNSYNVITSYSIHYTKLYDLPGWFVVEYRRVAWLPFWNGFCLSTPWGGSV